MKLAVLNNFTLAINSAATLISQLMREAADGIFVVSGAPLDSIATSGFAGVLAKDSDVLNVSTMTLAGVQTLEMMAATRELTVTKTGSRWEVSDGATNLAHEIRGTDPASGNAYLSGIGELAEAVSNGKCLTDAEAIIIDQPNSKILVVSENGGQAEDVVIALGINGLDKATQGFFEAS